MELNIMLGEAKKLSIMSELSYAQALNIFDEVRQCKKDLYKIIPIYESEGVKGIEIYISQLKLTLKKEEDFIEKLRTYQATRELFKDLTLDEEFKNRILRSMEKDLYNNGRER